MADKRTDDQKVRDITMRFTALEQERKYYEPLWDDIIDLVTHYRRPIQSNSTQRGGRTGMNVWDGTPLAALNLLADGLHGYLVSPSFRWFSLTLPNKVAFSRTSLMRSQSGQRLDDIDEVRQWLQDVEDVMYAAYLRSNFYDTTPEFYRDGGSIGTATTYHEEDVSKGRIIFDTPHPREIFIAQDRFGQVDTVYRRLTLKHRQMKQKFDEDKLKAALPNWDNLIEKSPFSEQTIIHAVEPREEYDENKGTSKDKPYASYWMIEGGKTLLMESGYDLLPYEVWRWRKNGDEVYGQSPASDALVEIFMANQFAKNQLGMMAKVLDPPYAVHESQRGKTHMGAKGMNYFTRDDQVPRPLLPNQSGYPLTLEHQRAMQDAIRAHFHVDFFMMLSRAAFEKTNITATQVIEMQGEKAAILGTRIGRIQTEQLNPNIDAVFANERRAGRIPDPPDILAEFGGGSIEVDYLGPLAQAQKRLFKMQSINSGLNSLAPLVQMFPEILDAIDPDKTADEILQSNGFPQVCMRPMDVRAGLRQQRAKQQQSQQMAQMGLEMAKALPAAGKAVDPTSPLGAMMGQSQSPGAT